MWSARPVGSGFSPLDERLELLPSPYSPYLIEAIVRLGTLLPFEQVPEQFAFLTGVPMTADTVRRLTEQAGSLQVAIDQAAVEHLEHEAPAELPGPAVQQLSADGVMVSLLGKQWKEVRVLAIGTVETSAEGKVHTTDLSYFSRLCSADQFVRQATLPTHERGTRRAGTVVAVMDGASWLQEVIDEHCPQAVRVLDFPHAVSHLNKAAQAAFGAGSREAAVWLDEWAPQLKQGKLDEVLAAIKALPMPTEQGRTDRRTVVRYLGARREQLQYGHFREQGYPIGSGIVESAAKGVVQARLKGPGMHWARQNVNPMLALRSVLCSRRWSTAWPVIWKVWRAQVKQRRTAARQRRQAARAAKEAAANEAAAQDAPAPTPRRKRDKLVVDGKPTEDHPWRKRSPFKQPRPKT